MDRTERASVLLRALSDVDERYIAEAAGGAPAVEGRRGSARRVVPGRFLGVAAAVAACLLLLLLNRSLLLPDRGGDAEQSAAAMTEVSGIAQAEGITGFGLQYPAPGGEYGTERVTVYDGDLIEVSFETEDGTDTGYYIRKSSESGDISGDFGEYAQTRTEEIAGQRVTLKGDGSRWSVAIWTADGYSYAIGCQAHPMSLQELTGRIGEIR